MSSYLVNLYGDGDLRLPIYHCTRCSDVLSEVGYQHNCWSPSLRQAKDNQFPIKIWCWDCLFDAGDCRKCEKPFIEMCSGCERYLWDDKPLES